VISGFRREVDENCALLGYYAASSGNCLPTFRDNLSVPSSGYEILNPDDGTDRFFRNVCKKLFSFLNPTIGFFTLEDGTDTLSRNVGKKLSLLAA